MAGPLKGIKVLDLSRILAGPWATQVLADYGADVIKVEHPKGGDDTRQWGPPFASVEDNYIEKPHSHLTDPNQCHTPSNNQKLNNDAAYFLAANRGKRSLTVDFSTPLGLKIIQELILRSDVLVENYKVGGLQKYGLDYQSVKSINPKIIYCSITGFGQTGPYRERPGYDAIIQGMGGLMSVTGEPEEYGGGPQKVGVAVADLMTGMYAVTAITSALYHRSQTGEGQLIDLALLDTQVAWLANQNMNYLTGGEIPKRHGTAHPNIVPYQSVAASDGYFMLAVGNDEQFRRLCQVIEKPELSSNALYLTNQLRVHNKASLIEWLSKTLITQSVDYWLVRLTQAKVPCAPINNIAQVFEDPQIKQREMQFSMPHKCYGKLPQVANPVKFSKTQIEYNRAPPVLGQHNYEILNELGLNLETAEKIDKTSNRKTE